MRFGDQLDFFSGDFGTYKSLLYFENYIPNGYLIRKSIFNKIEKFTPDAPLEDYYLMLQISKYAKMKYLPDTLFYYRWHGANATTKKDMVDITTRTQLHEIKDICPRIYHHILGIQAQNTDLHAKLAKAQEQYLDAQNQYMGTQSELIALKNSRTYFAGKIVLAVPKMVKRLLFQKNK
jgi:alpha-1,3-rhamnosyltransferase